MKRNLHKNIPFVYGVLTILYFAIAILFYDAESTSNKGFIETILASLGNLIYWVFAIGTYLAVLWVSSLIGLLLNRQKKDRAYRQFRGVFMLATILLVIATIIYWS